MTTPSVAPCTRFDPAANPATIPVGPVRLHRPEGGGELVRSGGVLSNQLPDLRRFAEGKGYTVDAVVPIHGSQPSTGSTSSTCKLP